MAAGGRTQKARSIALFTPLGDDKLLLESMHGSEALGRLFHFSLDLYAEEPVDPNKILCLNITVRLDLISGGYRYFNGYVSRFALVSIDESTPAEKIYHYRAEVVPWLWFLTRQADCRIFQDMTVPDIIQKIIKDRGFSNVKSDLSGTYRKWVNCVQYRETDFNFISRLMENEGIYYFFDHEDGKHFLHLCDSPTAHKAADGAESLHHDTGPVPSSDNDNHIWDWSLGQEITPNSFAHNDYDPLQPKAQLLSPSNVSHEHDPDTYEIYDYPGGYVTGDEGKTYAKIRMEELESVYEVGHGSSSSRGIHVGAIFKLEDHPVCDGEYLVTAVNYQLKNNALEVGVGGGEEDDFSCMITCIPKKYTFRTARTTPKPLVMGPQTAKVTTPKGEEIHCDKYGRVKVKFHWDRSIEVNENSSCWVRVSQPWAGKKWGVVSIPRKDQEVIVEFLEGDPDNPIITGRVFNADQMPPYELPANATQTSFKSNAKSGGNFNEIRLEDKDNEGQLYTYAGHNYDLRVKNDRYETVENDMHVTVSNNSLQEIQRLRPITSRSVPIMQVDIGADNHINIAGLRGQGRRRRHEP